jgi:hypothetical protein
MSQAPEGWLPDPLGKHQYRFRKGGQWTEFVANDGVETTDLLESPRESSVMPWAGDSLWEGERQSLTAVATGGKVVSARYRITKEYIYFDAGLLSNRSEQVPLWALRDVDVKQSLTQKARGVGDVVVRVQHDDYTGRSEVVLASVADPKSVRDLLNAHAQPARLEHQRRQQTHFYQQDLAHQPQPQPQSQTAQTDSSSSLVTQLKGLAELRDQGILTDAEFQAQKEKMLNP